MQYFIFKRKKKFDYLLANTSSKVYRISRFSDLIEQNSFIEKKKSKKRNLETSKKRKKKLECFFLKELHVFT